MENKNSGIFLLLLFICIFGLAYLFVNSTANAQYPVNNYYEYTIPNLTASYLYNNTYSNNYSWSMTQNFGKELIIPTPLMNDWTVQPAFGNTVYAATTKENTLTIYGTYFSAHTHAGVNFNRTLSLGESLYSGSLYSMPYIQPSQTMYQSFGGQSSYISNYARQVLQFSPVLHGPLLGY